MPRWSLPTICMKATRNLLIQLLGYTTYKMSFATREGLLPAILLMILPFVILAVLVRLLPPWHAPEAETTPG